MLKMFIIFLFLVGALSNYLKNPSFEEGNGIDITNWRNQYETCQIDTTIFHSGKQSLHCKDASTSQRGGIKQRIDNLETGMTYKLSAYIRMKDVQNGNVLIFSESLDSEEGIYGYSSSITECTSGTCNDKWYLLEIVGNSGFIQSAHTFGILLHAAGALGEFWIDDVSMEAVNPDILTTLQVVSWRQEAYKDEIEIRSGINVENTIFEKGDYLSFKLELSSQTTSSKLTSETYTLKKELRQRIVSFIINPSTLNPGYYTVKLTCTNSYKTQKVESIETTLRVLDHKPSYTTYIDEHLITWKDGKKFFPLGLYFDEIVDSDLELLKDSPFNLIIGPGGMTPETVQHIYTATNNQINVIRPVTKGACVDPNKCSEQDFNDGLVILKGLISQFKDIEGFFGYYPVDEPLTTFIDRLKQVTWTIRENDEKHVVYTAVNKNREVATLKEGMDCFGLDVYPVQNEEPLYAVWLVAERGRKGVANGQGLWNIIQIFDWTVYKKPNEEPPTEQQIRQMTYQTIAGGSMGIIYYDFTDLHKMNSKTSFDKQWNSVKKIAQELKDKYVDIIYSIDIPNENYNLPEQGHDVGTRIWKKDNSDYILIVNNQNKEITYTFDRPSEDLNLEIISGTSTIQYNGTRVTLKMPSMDVVWLKSDEYKENKTNSLQILTIILIIMLWFI
ncbi:carbohydrate binding domain containing protein [Entamoeba histolytica HM-3:IMSS]|uniref:Carbohydrate binding domain containing protein n=2 Tax=Entamoeba histolytica TaxID=5759 RepID=M7WAA3_ENTHI|nr:carbohydrate binding domain containing protein [Entamoeba histolytica HM-3:IMSS]